MIVQRRLSCDQRVHVGDGNQDFHGPARQALCDGELIEVPGLIVIDGTPEKLREVASRGVRRGPVDAAQLRERLGGEIRDETLFHHYAARDFSEEGPVLAWIGHRICLVKGFFYFGAVIR